jgi:hypothetical protein
MVVTLKHSEGSHRLSRRFFTSFRMTIHCVLDSPKFEVKEELYGGANGKP